MSRVNTYFMFKIWIFKKLSVFKRHNTSKIKVKQKAFEELRTSLSGHDKVKQIQCKHIYEPQEYFRDKMFNNQQKVS